MSEWHRNVQLLLDEIDQCIKGKSDEALTLSQALDAFSAAGAYASFEENEKGRIEKGHLADFTVLGADPFLTRRDCIHSIPVRAVYLGGREVYRA